MDHGHHAAFRLSTFRKVGGYDETYRIRRPDGTVVWIRDRVFPIRDQQGNVVRIAGVATDITTQRRLEEQLSQSQKLESIGRLAGGIAHDFNNLLTVILTAAHFALRGLPPDGATARDLRQVKEAAERAAKLTAQLLAFARRQVIAPARLDLNDLTRQTDRLLRRVIGEHIDLTTVLAPGLKPVMADRGQIEQVLVNLAVNARDAMIDGGRLTLETANVTVDRAYAATHANIDPGEYVMLAVSDTGQGMSAEGTRAADEPAERHRPVRASHRDPQNPVDHAAHGRPTPCLGREFQSLAPRATVVVGKGASRHEWRQQAKPSGI